MAGASLATTFIPGGAIEKVAVKGVEKLGGKFLIRVTGRSEGVLGKLVKARLNPGQVKAFKQFERSFSKSEQVYIYTWKNGGKSFHTITPGKNGTSFTVWERYYSKDLNSPALGHRTYTNDGKFIHWHEKLPVNKLEINTENAYYTRMDKIIKESRL